MGAASVPFSVCALWYSDLAILESSIPLFRVLHLPHPKYSLSAYEHSLISSASQEFLPPATSIFRNVNGVVVGLCAQGTSVAGG